MKSHTIFKEMEKLKITKRLCGILLVVCSIIGMAPIAYAAESHADVSSWLLSECQYSEEENCFVLTEDYTQWDTGAIWYNTPCEDDFTLELDYYTGSTNRHSNGADGIAIAFYANYSYEMVGGEEMGFNGSKGYGIELDTYYNGNRSDPIYNHIALIKESVGNHLATAALPESEDEQWHHLKIVVENNTCTVYVDDTEKLSHAIEKTGYAWIGITSATGSGENKHAVKNIVVSGENTGITEAKYLDMQLSHEKLSDENSTYTYKISANITNKAQATAPNMVAKLSCDEPLTLADGVSAEITVGDLAPGTSKTVSWNVRAAWPTESCAVNYSVTADIDNAAASLQQESYIYLQAKNEHDNSFVFGQDQWYFDNSDTYFNPTGNENYYISQADLNALLENVSNIDKFYVNAMQRYQWAGSCYGMSATAILAKIGVLSPDQVQSGASDLYHVTKTSHDDAVESLINFYHLLQCTTPLQNNKSQFSLQTTAAQLSELEQKASRVPTGGNPVLLCFGMYGTDKADGTYKRLGGHAVVAYGVEYKGDGWFDGWGWEPGYDSRILLYDCNYPKGVTYLYFNHGTDSFKLKQYDYDIRLERACNDITLLDAVNYDTSTQNRYATLRFESAAGKYFLNRDGQKIAIDGTVDLRNYGMAVYGDDSIPADGTANASGFTLVLPSLDESYTIEPASSEPAQFSLTYKNTLLSASVDTAASLSFSPDGEITAHDAAGDYELSLCANEGYQTLTWDLVTVKGSQSEDISLKQTRDGIMITGSDLSNAEVTVEDQAEAKTISISTEQEAVLIKDAVVDGADVPVAWVDTDGNGNFETSLNGDDDQPEEPSDDENDDGNSGGTNDDSDNGSNSGTDNGSNNGSSGESGTGNHGGNNEVSYYAVHVNRVSNGVVSVSPTNAAKNATVSLTVTPDSGYTLKSLTVLDANGNAVELTNVGNEQYTFLMPGSSVTIYPSFTPVEDHSMAFTDVHTGDYYYDAVLWAVANGVTNGTGAASFSPNSAVSRAQMVTFLWRAHGSPKATGVNPFTDVRASDYYYDAVLWAVANGVTNGTGTASFSPDIDVTRAQAVAFQWRAAGSPAASGSSFDDVTADAYYRNAVTWAVANGITNGTGSNRFSPAAVVSRAQAVTFLYREQV